MQAVLGKRIDSNPLGTSTTPNRSMHKLTAPVRPDPHDSRKELHRLRQRVRHFESCAKKIADSEVAQHIAKKMSRLCRRPGDKGVELGRVEVGSNSVATLYALVVLKLVGKGDTVKPKISFNLVTETHGSRRVNKFEAGGNSVYARYVAQALCSMAHVEVRNIKLALKKLERLLFPSRGRKGWAKAKLGAQFDTSRPNDHYPCKLHFGKLNRHGSLPSASWRRFMQILSDNSIRSTVRR